MHTPLRVVLLPNLGRYYVQPWKLEASLRALTSPETLKGNAMHDERHKYRFQRFRVEASEIFLLGTHIKHHGLEDHWM